MHDRLGKVRPLIDHLNREFCSLYGPSRDVAVDEAFQGRSTLKQYMPMKPIKHGVKVWVLGGSISVDLKYTLVDVKRSWEHTW